MGQPVQGNRHHDNTDRGSPVKIGGKAATSVPTAVANNDRVDAYFDEFGRLHIIVENVIGETASVGVGAAADAEATGSGSVIAILKRLRTLLNGGLPAALSASGAVKAAVIDAIPAGSAVIGKVDLNSLLDGLQDTVSLLPRADSAGLTMSRTIAAATTNATSVKTTAGKLHYAYVSNINAAVRYLKVYNKASAPTVGTDTPVLTLPIPGDTAGGAFVFSSELGLKFATGIAFALTTGVADADTGAVAANEHVVNLGYV